MIYETLFRSNVKTHFVVFKTVPYSYQQVLDKSIQFYEAQRSGRLPLTQRVKWRNNSTQNDGSDNGVDLEGGWFDGKTPFTISHVGVKSRSIIGLILFQVETEKGRHQ